MKNIKIPGDCILARVPRHVEKDGYIRYFSPEWWTKLLPGTDLDILDGGGLVKVENMDERIKFTASNEELELDIPGMKMPSKEVAWVYPIQPKYRPGDVLQGFVVSRVRLNPYVMALRRSKTKDGRVALVNCKSKKTVVSIPIDLTPAVVEFSMDLSDKKYMQVGMHEIQIHDSKGAVIGGTKIEIDHFKKRDLRIVADAPSWTPEGKDFVIAVRGEYYHGAPVNSGDVLIVDKSGKVLKKEKMGDDGIIEFKMPGFPEGKGVFHAVIVDDQGRTDEVDIEVISTAVPAKFVVLLPSETIYSTMPVTFTVKLETPDCLPIPNTKVDVSLTRYNKMSNAEDAVVSRTIETNVNGQFDVDTTPDLDGTYTMRVHAIVNDQEIVATKKIPVSRFTDDVVIIKNVPSKDRYAEGEKIKGTITLHGGKDIDKVDHGYIDLVTDKIIESRRVEIKDRTVAYEFTGISDFWGTAGIEFYVIKPRMMRSASKDDTVNGNAMVVIEPTIPLELNVKVTAPATSMTGKTVSIRVNVDSRMMSENTRIFGALIDKRIVNAHESRNIEKTFLKAPKPLEVLWLEGIRKVQTKGFFSLGMEPDGLIGSSFDSYGPSYRASMHAGSGDYQSMLLSRSARTSFNLASSKPPGGYSSGAFSSSPPAQRFVPSIGTVVEEGISGEIVREDFSESVLIAPVDVKDGHAVIDVNLPDAVTTYEVVIFAAGDMQFGEGITEMVVKNPVFTQLLNPARMVLDEDEVEISAIIHNTMGSDIHGVNAGIGSLKNIRLVGDPAKVVGTIPAGGASKVQWIISGNKVGDANLALDVTTGGFKECMTLDQPLFIAPPGKPIVETIKQMVDQEHPMKVSIKRAGEAFCLGVVSVLPSLEVAHIDGLESLAQYPHGCMEQTCSSTLPNAVVFEYMKLRGTLTPPMREKLLENMKSGIDRMMSYRNDDGGFSYWGGKSSPFYTALGLWVMSKIRSVAPNIVNDRVFNMAGSYLERCMENGHWSGSGNGHAGIAPRILTDNAMTAFVIRALSNIGYHSKGTESAMKWLNDSFNSYLNDPMTIAMVLEAWGISHQYRKAFPDLGELLMRTLYVMEQESGDEIYWNAGSSLTRSTVESTAMVMIAISKSTDHVDAITVLQKSVNHLLNHRGARGWRSTSDTLLASMALSTVGKDSGGKTYAMTVLKNGHVIKRVDVLPHAIDWVVHDMRDIYIDEIDADVDVEIRIEGNGKCHAVIDVERYYHERNAGESAMKSTVSLLDKSTVGDDLLVTVDIVASKPLESVMIEVPVPAGLAFDPKNVDELNRQCQHAEFKNGTINVFFQSIDEKTNIAIPFTAKFPGKCRVGGKAYEMYASSDVDIEPKIMMIS